MKRTSPLTVAKVASDIKAGYSQEEIARRHHVSNVTIVAIRRKLAKLKTPDQLQDDIEKLRKENKRLRTTIRILRHHAATRTIVV